MVRLPTHAFRALALTAVLALAGTGVTACVNARNPGSDLAGAEVLARYTPKDETDGTGQGGGRLRGGARAQG